MGYIGVIVCLAGVAQFGAFPADSLLFGPIKLVCLIVWFYLCMHLARNAEASDIVPEKHKEKVTASSLLIGPLLFFFLFVADRAKKIEQGVITFADVVREIFNFLFRWSGRATKTKQHSAIELMDAAGRSFFEVYGSGGSNTEDSSEILQLTENIILDAINESASDILMDPKAEDIYSLRFRVDGVLKTMDHIQTDKCAAVINSIKAISSMDIAEKRRPQDGSFTGRIDGGMVSFRVASAGVLNGEKLSIRVLNQSSWKFSLTNIGMTNKQYTVVKKAVSKPSGMILMCGPTGSGKTTTLYSMLNEIDMYTRNVVTVEDPIEYVLPDASQIEVNPKADITFAKSLRSILRQDPDVICVGEIRDEETAKIALQASQTGHLVLATMHSNSNAASVVRLLDLGASPLMITSGLTLLVSQRLLRCLCDNCKISAELTQHQIDEFERKKINYMNICCAEGCPQCDGTGYKGRTAIYDMLVFDNVVKKSIASSEAMITQMRTNGDRKGKSNLYKQGLKAVVVGRTSLEELKRVVG